MRITVLSLGAGVQSTTLALMSAEGVLAKPDAAVFADTGWEPRHVYEHLGKLNQVLKGVRVPLFVVSAGNLREDTLNPAHRYASIPYFTQMQPGPCERCHVTGRVVDVESGQLVRCPRCRGSKSDDGKGQGRRQCTAEYKLAPIRRKARELLGAPPPDFRTVPRGRQVEQWIGFSADEIGRVGDHDERLYLINRYPLIELGWSRRRCQNWLEARGWTVAKSACIGCPFHGNAQWRALRDTCDCRHHRDIHLQISQTGRGVHRMLAGSPEAGSCTYDLCSCDGFRASGWHDAVAFDEAIRKGGSRGLPLSGEAFLHRSRVPLAIAPIDHRTRAERRGEQLDLLDEFGDPDGCSPYGCRSGEPPTDER